MNKKLIAALFAGAFSFTSASAMADDKTPPTPVDQAKLKAERDAAKAKFAAMSPEEKAATLRHGQDILAATPGAEEQGRLGQAGDERPLRPRLLEPAQGHGGGAPVDVHFCPQ